MIEKALSFQNGNRGFGYTISNLFIITGKLSHFSSKERHQVYIDCGLYSMSLILALHSHGVSTCALNMSDQFGRERIISKALGFSDDEVPIMMIAAGYASKDASSANSSRRYADEFIFFDNI